MVQVMRFWMSWQCISVMAFIVRQYALLVSHLYNGFRAFVTSINIGCRQPVPFVGREGADVAKAQRMRENQTLAWRTITD